MQILVTDGLDASACAALEAQGHHIVNQWYNDAELEAVLPHFHTVILRSATKLRANHLLAAAKGNLKLIIRAGVGVDNIDTATAESLGIVVRNTPLASTNSVAEAAIAHIFSCARYLSIAGHTMRLGKWEKKAYSHGFELRNKTLGILGFGRIGRRVAEIATGIGMNVLVYDPAPLLPIIESAKMRSLHDVLSCSDVISLHTPALPQPIIGTEAIQTMKDGVVIINTSRGCNIDESALLSALDSGKVRAAGLDVWKDEPSGNNRLYAHPAVSCSPHIGAATEEAQSRIGQEIVAIISSFAE